MATRRVEIRDLAEPTPLRPMAQPVDTYAAPEKPPINNDLERLAKSLQSFGAVISTAANQKPKEDPREAEIYRIRASSNDAEFVQLHSEGRIPYQDVPHIRALTANHLGETTARLVLDRVQTRIKDGSIPLTDEDGRPLDVNQIIQSALADGSIKLAPPGDLPWWKSYATALETGRNALLELQRTKVAEINAENIKTLAARSIDGVIQMAESPEGQKDDEIIRQYINKTTADARKYGGLRPAQMDDLWFGRIREIVDRNPDLAERLLFLDRGKGYDGKQPIGALAQNPKHADTVRELLLKITQVRAKRFDNEQEETLIAGAEQALRRADGSFGNITGHAYENPFAKQLPNENPSRTLSAEAIKDKALARYQSWSDRDFLAQYADPFLNKGALAAQFERDYSVYTMANRPNPRWANTLTTASRLLSNPQQLSQPDNLQKVQAAYELWCLLGTRNPGYLEKTLRLDERDERFFRQMRVYREVLGSTPEMAAQQAAQFINTEHPPVDGKTQEAIRKAADSVDLSWLPMHNGYYNVPLVRKMVFDAAVAIAADRNILPAAAVPQAVKIVRARAFSFNGQMVPPDPHLNADNAKLFQQRLDEVYKEHKHSFEALGITSSKHLSLVRIDGNRFKVIKSDGTPVYLPMMVNGEVRTTPVAITASDIEAIRAQNAKKLYDETLKRHQNNLDRKVMTAPTAKDARAVRMNIKTPTEQEQDMARARYFQRNPDEKPKVKKLQ